MPDDSIGNLQFQENVFQLELSESDSEHPNVARALAALQQSHGLPLVAGESHMASLAGEPLDVGAWYALASELLAAESDSQKTLRSLYDAAEASNVEAGVAPILIICQDATLLDEAALRNLTPESVAAMAHRRVRVMGACCQGVDPTDFLQESHYCVMSLNPQFLFDDPFVVGNAASSISGVEVDFGEGGGMRRMEKGVPLSVVYQNPGAYQMRTLVHFADGSTEESHGMINVDPPGVAAGADTGKVFVMAGGFSPKAGALQGSTDNIKAPLRAAGWTEVTIGGYDHKKARIEKNAQALIDSLIAYDVHTPISSICVMGFSMGGLVARMALAMMSRSYPELYDKVRVFVPMDSPLEGAYLGLSTQMVMRFASKKWKLTIPEEKGLDSDPAKQMLLLWTQPMDDKNRLAFYHPHPMRAELIRNLAGFYPKGKTIVCLSCGSEVGKRQTGMKPGGTVFHWSKGALSWEAYVELHAVPDKKKSPIAQFYRIDKDWGTKYTYSSSWDGGGFSIDDASGSTSSYNDSMAKAFKKYGGDVDKRVDTTVYIPSTSAMGYGGNVHDPMNRHQEQSPATNWFYIADNGAHDPRYISQAIGKQVADIVIKAEQEAKTKAKVG